MAKTLIAFFSRADENYFGGAMRYVKVGNTEIVVGLMKDMIEADTFKIEMKNPYSPVYMTCIEEAKKDLRAKARPELVSMPESIDEYDTVVLAYPNYWGTMPMAVFTFLEAFDFSGKTILPLCTNEGSGLSGSERDIKKTCPGAIVKSGLSITGSNAAGSGNKVKKWLSANGTIFDVLKPEDPRQPAVTMDRFSHGDKSLISESVFTELGKKYGKTSAQVILRWHTQMGFAVIPGSKNVDHIRDNLDILDFTLNDEEMAEIAKLDKGVRYYNRTDEQLVQFAGWRPEFEKHFASGQV